MYSKNQSEHRYSFIYLRYNWIRRSQDLNDVAASLAEKCRQSRGSKQQVNKDFAPAFTVALTSLELSGAFRPDK